MLKRLENLYRQYFPKRMKNYKFFISTLSNKNGIEIGGPSSAFDSKGYLPIYSHLKTLDGCNFSSTTIWEGNISEGKNFTYGNRKGMQIISDGIKLDTIKNNQYDFLVSCHSLEHFANPLKALEEWKRIINDNGYILLVVPHKDNTFDHRRPITTLEHLIKDYKSETKENDTTHFEEVIKLHDISMDEGIKDCESLKKRTFDNFNNRSVHHHVFNTPLLVKIANHLNFKICDIQHFNPFNIIILIQKSEQFLPDNSNFLNHKNEVYQKEKFPSDKIW